ncbi:hypothetical protein B0A52_08358 [Exophiala mesophila]|uniref:Major facilitator superfamily (MFS) profile domain-containing protein n=1 Tax=Exophiala mesophila TaxID=212818 RepID=A0A438MTT2_EXOME|nr:hypothetical protein B0A52_08358 [Exophiala mesophila]
MALDKDTSYAQEVDVAGSQFEMEKADPEGALATNVVSAIDHAAEKKLLRKLDIRIMPLIMGLYLFSFLDRVNIGNARVYGMEQSLGLTGSQFQLSVSIFFVTYVLFEIPSNMIIKKITPSKWLAFITFSWGIISTLTGMTQNLGGLIACRILMGIFEAGLFPGLSLYLTTFYTRQELGLRYSWLFTCNGLAGALGGLIAYAIGHMEDVGGLEAWRWIFILEGLPTIILGAITWFALADFPQTAHYLSQEERDLLMARRGRQAGFSASWDEMHKSDVMKGVKDWKVYVMAFGQFCGASMLYGYSTFLPTIILDLGTWNRVVTNAMTIPCYALGVITYIIIGWISDRLQLRGCFPAACGIISVIGYGVLLAPVSAAAHYAGCLLVGMGLYVFVGMPLAWLPMNCPKYGKRAFASAFQLTISNLSGVIVPFLYTSNFGPRYIQGNGAVLGWVGTGTIIYGSMFMYYVRKNAGRVAGKEDHKIEGKTEEQIADMGDESPRFIYVT